MLNRRPKYDVVEKFRRFRNIYDKIYTLFTGTLWIFSTILDIYNLQRYWLDYTAEFYGCFFLFIMMVFSINPKLLPVKIYNSFSLITTIRGKATLLIIISSIFLKDNHSFNRFCAFLLLIGGIIYIICEILVPTTREELEQIESYYNNKNNNSNANNTGNNNNINNNNINNNNINNNNNIEDNIQVTIDNNNNVNIETNKSISGLENSEAVLNDVQNEVDFKRDLNEKDNNVNNNMKATDEKNNEGKENNINENGLIEEEIIRKTDNPYEIPEDF